MGSPVQSSRSQDSSVYVQCISNLSMWMKSSGVTIQIKAYFKLHLLHY